MKQFTLLISLILILTPQIYSIDQSLIQKTLDKAQENIWQRYEDNHWNYPTYLGQMFISMYYFESRGMDWTEKTQFNETYHKSLILESQLPDGSWQQLEEQNENTSSIDASIYNYWFLKSMGEDPQSPHMIKAKDWIVSKGGVEAAQTMTRYKMALFGQYDWADTMYIPLFIFDKDHPLKYFTYSKDFVAQWVYPHLTAFAYLRYFRAFKPVGADIFELWANPPQKLELSERETGPEPEEAVLKLVDEIFSVWRPKGSIGTYTVSTYLNLFSLKHFMENWPNHPYVPKIKHAIEIGFDFIEMNFFNKHSPYTGQLDDGRWWDTLLVTWALQEAGTNTEKLDDVVDKLISDAVQDNGGVSYGWEFEYKPDTDDTAVFITLLAGMKHNKYKYNYQLEKSLDFLTTYQNDDGGYGAFDREFQGNWFYEVGFHIAQIQCSAEIFDYSSVDITGHMLEAMAATGYNTDNVYVQRAINYLEKTYTNFGENHIAWSARWGINYIYSSGAIIPGLARVGYDMTNPMIKKNIDWLVSKQNEDGGFGESTLSYNYPEEWNGRGKSTPTCTGWALMALLEVTKEYPYVNEVIEKAMNYLLEEFWTTQDRNGQEGFWYDKSVVGTGHRKVLYLQYPAYSQAFPLIAMGRYQQMYSNKCQNGELECEQ